MKSPLVVAAGLRPAVEPGVRPGGTGERRYKLGESTLDKFSGRRDATLYGRRDARRYPFQSILKTFAGLTVFNHGSRRESKER
jgi:hypothetical protein